MGKFGWLLVILAFWVGLWRTQIFEASRPVHLPYAEFLEAEVKVVLEPDRRADKQFVTVKHADYGKIRLSLSPYENIEWGDRLLVRGVLEAPDYNEGHFDYELYLARYGTWSLVSPSRIELLSRAPPGPVPLLFSFKELLEQRLNRLYFEPEASFAAGLLLGLRKGMPEELSLAFQKTGLMHLVAISGYNISLIIVLIFSLLTFLSFQKRIFWTCIAILFFVILVGASSAVLRAGLMGALGLVGLYSGRKSQAVFGLLWSVIILVFYQPYTLLYDVGFQLSVFATLGLFFVYPILDEKIPKISHPKLSALNWVREAFLLTTAAQSLTLPVQIYNFGQLSLLSPIANVLVAPAIPFAMLFSALSLVFGKTMALIAIFYLKWVEGVALIFAKIPLVTLPMNFSSLDLVLIYISIFGLLTFFYRSKLARAFGLCRRRFF